MIATGERMPAISVLDSNGQSVDPAVGPSSTPYTLVFFKAACPTCQFALPFLQRADKDQRLIVVSQDSPEVTSQFARKFQAPLDYHFDRADDNYPASNALGLNYVPSLIRVDSEGRVVDAAEGFDKAFFEDLGVAFQASEKVPNFKPG